MRRWNRMIGVALVLALAIVYGLATRVMIAKAVLPPHATRLEILVTVLKPPYQMAAPHFNLLKQMRGFFRPTVVHAQVTCGTSPCAYSKQQPVGCSPSCTGTGYCNCPDCVYGTCHWYACASSTLASDTCDDSLKYWGCDQACSGYGACTK
jgi:hypothetical protein